MKTNRTFLMPRIGVVVVSISAVVGLEVGEGFSHGVGECDCAFECVAESFC